MSKHAPMDFERREPEATLTGSFDPDYLGVTERRDNALNATDKEKENIEPFGDDPDTQEITEGALLFNMPEDQNLGRASSLIQGPNKHGEAIWCGANGLNLEEYGSALAATACLNFRSVSKVHAEFHDFEGRSSTSSGLAGEVSGGTSVNCPMAPQHSLAAKEKVVVYIPKPSEADKYTMAALKQTYSKSQKQIRPVLKGLDPDDVAHYMKDLVEKPKESTHDTKCRSFANLKQYSKEAMAKSYTSAALAGVLVLLNRGIISLNVKRDDIVKGGKRKRTRVERRREPILEELVVGDDLGELIEAVDFSMVPLSFDPEIGEDDENLFAKIPPPASKPPPSSSAGSPSPPNLSEIGLTDETAGILNEGYIEQQFNAQTDLIIKALGLLEDLRIRISAVQLAASIVKHFVTMERLKEVAGFKQVLIANNKRLKIIAESVMRTQLELDQTHSHYMDAQSFLLATFAESAQFQPIIPLGFPVNQNAIPYQVLIYVKYLEAMVDDTKRYFGTLNDIANELISYFKSSKFISENPDGDFFSALINRLADDFFNFQEFKRDSNFFSKAIYGLIFNKFKPQIKDADKVAQFLSSAVPNPFRIVRFTEQEDHKAFWDLVLNEILSSKIVFKSDPSENVQKILTDLDYDNYVGELKESVEGLSKKFWDELNDQLDENQVDDIDFKNPNTLPKVLSNAILKASKFDKDLHSRKPNPKPKKPAPPVVKIVDIIIPEIDEEQPNEPTESRAIPFTLSHLLTEPYDSIKFTPFYKNESGVEKLRWLRYMELIGAKLVGLFGQKRSESPVSNLIVKDFIHANLVAFLPKADRSLYLPIYEEGRGTLGEKLNDPVASFGGHGLTTREEITRQLVTTSLINAESAFEEALVLYPRTFGNRITCVLLEKSTPNQTGAINGDGVRDIFFGATAHFY